MTTQIASIPRPALILGIGGLLPFSIAAIAAIILTGSHGSQAPSSEFAVFALGAYGAVILSFLGGVRWGRLLYDEVKLEQWAPLTLSVVPSLIAWPALLLDSSQMLLLLVVGFAMQYALDNAAVKRQELPAWFGRLRLILTSGALISLLAALTVLYLN